MERGMSKMEQILYFRLEEKGQRIFSVNDIIDILKVSEYRARNIASSMVRKDVVERVKPGLFSRIPVNIILDKRQYHEDAIMIASKLTDDYFISHYSAAKAHGFAERYSNHVYISSMSHQRDLAYHDNLIKFLRVTPDRFFGIEKLKYMNDIIMISDIERTMIDIVNRPKLSGDWTEVIEVMKNIQKIDQERFLQYLMKFNNKRTARISGFLLDNIKSIDLENDIKERIMEFSGDNIYYMNKDHYDNNLDKEWNLIVPRRIKGGFND